MASHPELGELAQLVKAMVEQLEVSVEQREWRLRRTERQLQRLEQGMGTAESLLAERDLALFPPLLPPPRHLRVVEGDPSDE